MDLRVCVSDIAFVVNFDCWIQPVDNLSVSPGLILWRSTFDLGLIKTLHKGKSFTGFGGSSLVTPDFDASALAIFTLVDRPRALVGILWMYHVKQ